MVLALVVDDEPDIRRSIRNILESIDVQVIEASDGQSCIENARRQTPDVILLDVMMPGLKTRDILKGLGSNETTKSIPVIIVTVMRLGKEELEKLMTTTQVVNYIMKPFSVDTVIDAVQGLKNGS